MNNQIKYIPSGNVGEMYLDRIDKHWYRRESTEYANEKIIPFLKFLYDLIGVRAKYWTNHIRLRRNEEIPGRIVKVTKTASKLIESFNRIRGFADDLFCKGDIRAIDYALEVYEQYVGNEDLDPFLYNSFEINLTLKTLKPELEKFYKNLEKLTPRIIKICWLQRTFDWYAAHNTKKFFFFFEYLEEQFKEVIILNGKYSSGLFTTIEGIFFERIYQ